MKISMIGIVPVLLKIMLIDSAFANLKTTVNVTVFSAKESSVNTYVFSDSQGTLIVDSTRTSKDARELAALARTRGVPPKIILITHGHPDHFMGIGVLRKEFPGAQILVPNDQIKDDIIQFEKRMETMKWMESEPSMKSKSESNPGGFDYQNEIGILDSDKLTMPGGEMFEISTDFPTTEAAHETVLYSKELNALFPSDLVYSGVHLWLGPGVDGAAIRNWQKALAGLKSKYGPLKSKVYPGHGHFTDASVFDVDRRYMNDLLTVVKGAKNEEEARREMIKRYPLWDNSDFILVQSIRNQTKLSRQ